MDAPTVTSPQQLQPGTTLQRSFGVQRSAINEMARTVELAFASETPYARYWGVEILDCTATAMRMGRLTSGGPLLCDHDPKDQIGVIESVQLGADRVARAVVRFGKSARAEEVWRDVVDGIRRNVSVGYQIHAAQLVETNEEQDTYRVTDWEPYEVSLVSVPADASVGVGRSAQPATPATPETIPTKESTVTIATPESAAPAVAAPAITSADVQRQVAAERATMREIMAIGEQFARFDGIKIAKEGIEKGHTVDQVRGLIMNAMTAAQTTQAADLDLSKSDQKRFSVFKAIRALTDKTWKGAEFELECHNEILKRTGLPEAVHGGFFVPVDVQKRDLTVGTASAGGNLGAVGPVGQFRQLAGSQG
jgi:hypothetical protein